MILGRSDPEAQTQEATTKDAGHRALGLGDRQAQPRVDLAFPQETHDPLARLAAADIDVWVIRLADEGVARAFQFLVHLIKQHCGQKRGITEQTHHRW